MGFPSIPPRQAIGIPEGRICTLNRKMFGGDPGRFGQAIIDTCHKWQANLLFQCGWMARTPVNVISRFAGRIANQHPGPIDPGRLGFGGQGMMGLAVHEAVLHFAACCNRPFRTEASMHLVSEDGEYDNGTLIGMAPVGIFHDDTAETLQQRVLPVEHQLVIETLYRFATDSVIGITRPRPLIRPGEGAILEEAKERGISKYPKG